jgi:hypothetical protein
VVGDVSHQKELLAGGLSLQVLACDPFRGPESLPMFSADPLA